MLTEILVWDDVPDKLELIQLFLEDTDHTDVVIHCRLVRFGEFPFVQNAAEEIYHMSPHLLIIDEHLKGSIPGSVIVQYLKNIYGWNTPVISSSTTDPLPKEVRDIFHDHISLWSSSEVQRIFSCYLSG